MNTTKINIIGSIVLTISIIIIGGSASYAYYINNVVEENKPNQGVNVTTSDALSVNFATSEQINAQAEMLINDTEVLTKAKYTAFSIELPSSSKVSNIEYNLFLTDVEINDNFKSEYVKWALYNGNTQVAIGNFKNAVTGTDIPLLSNVAVARGDATTNYKLYIWLSNDENVNQISLLGGTLSAKVGYRAITK